MLSLIHIFVSFTRLLEKGFELLLKRGGQLVSPQIELQKHSSPRPIVPPGIAPAGQRLAETLAVFAADKSYDLLLLRDGDIGEIALFDQDPVSYTHQMCIRDRSS